jgi:hypothetical protein
VLEIYPKVPKPTMVDGTVLVDRYPKVPRPIIVDGTVLVDRYPKVPKPTTVDCSDREEIAFKATICEPFPEMLEKFPIAESI